MEEWEKKCVICCWLDRGQKWYNARPILFPIFIDGIDEEILCEISKFDDEAKIANPVNTFNDIRLIQRTLDKLVACTNRWDIDFNVNKCGIIHIRKKIQSFSTR